MEIIQSALLRVLHPNTMETVRKPAYSSLSDQVAGVLRRGIADHTWVARLPAERVLAASLNVSRRTLRNAIHILKNELVLRPAGRNGCLINSGALKKRIRHAQQRVAVLSPQPLPELRPYTTIWINELRALCMSAGVDLSVVAQPKCYGANGVRTLERLIRNNPQNCWIPLYSNAKTQRWFQANKVPCLLVNVAFTGIDLPDLDSDHRATARHAASQLLRMGHRSIALLSEASLRGDLLEAEAGFAEAFDGKTGMGLAPIVAKYREFTISEVVRTVEALFRHTKRPTAVIVTNSRAYLLTLCLLAQKGLRIPQDVSLLSTADDTIYSHLLPSPTFYRALAPEAVAKAIYRVVGHILREEPLTRRNTRLMTRFIRGDSISTPPA